ncbi:DUF6124 family protein [Pseudomonas sp. LjRoot277]|uniref:DUF6124 family protein n=1 Tax=Pseudomonas sp. LjRoot277 TaxID=3342307 RepID=UPI003ED1134B
MHCTPNAQVLPIPELYGGCAQGTLGRGGFSYLQWSNFPDANTEALTIQTYETFSTVSILLLDLAESLDDKPRHLAMAIYQLSELGLMLVERSLENETAIKTT